jgi:hypothetical protein
LIRIASSIIYFRVKPQVTKYILLISKSDRLPWCGVNLWITWREFGSRKFTTPLVEPVAIKFRVQYLSIIQSPSSNETLSERKWFSYRISERRFFLLVEVMFFYRNPFHIIVHYNHRYKSSFVYVIEALTYIAYYPNTVLFKQQSMEIFVRIPASYRWWNMFKPCLVYNESESDVKINGPSVIDNILRISDVVETRKPVYFLNSQP